MNQGASEIEAVTPAFAEVSARLPLARRAFDLLGLALLAPFVVVPLAVVGLAVFLDSPGSIFFRARRVGYRDVDFDMLKFRTMKVNNSGHSVAGANDNRITPVGGFLRATRLDELPQLWNVLRGDMSLVGPRPELREFVDLHAEDYREILSVSPGMTGPTQLRYAGVEPRLLSLHADPESYYRDHLLPDKVRMDADYARSRTFRGDLAVLLKTLSLPLLLPLRGRDSTEEDPVPARRSPLLACAVAVAAAMPLLFLLTLGSPR